jgi:V8-like Glu-specific endopeptidase
MVGQDQLERSNSTCPNTAARNPNTMHTTTHLCARRRTIGQLTYLRSTADSIKTAAVGSQALASCTGVLIDTNTILTAAHVR